MTEIYAHKAMKLKHAPGTTVTCPRCGLTGEVGEPEAHHSGIVYCPDCTKAETLKNGYSRFIMQPMEEVKK